MQNGYIHTEYTDLQNISRTYLEGMSSIGIGDILCDLKSMGNGVVAPFATPFPKSFKFEGMIVVAPLSCESSQTKSSSGMGDILCSANIVVSSLSLQLDFESWSLRFRGSVVALSFVVLFSDSLGNCNLSKNKCINETYYDSQ